MSSLVSDLRLALRSWRNAPVFASIAVASIAVGMGGSTAVFTLVDRVLLRPLPVAHPQELVQVISPASKFGSNWGDGSELSYPMYADFRDNAQVFSGMFCRFHFAFQLGYAGRTERVAGEIVSGTYFSVLGVKAALGRTLSAEDDRQRGGHPVAVLGHAFWTSRLTADPKVLGRTMVVNGHPLTIVGVAQQGFEGIEVGRPTQIFVPIMMKAQMTPGWDGLDDRRYAWVKVFGRLKPGVGREQAEARLQPFHRSRLEAEVQDSAFLSVSAAERQRFVETRVQLVSAAQGRSGFRRRLATPLWVLMATAVGVLLIACANVANLLMARAAARRREMAIRLALGASRRRLVRQLLVESVLLAVAGGTLGLALAVVGAPILLAFFASPDLPQSVPTLPDLRILTLTFAVSLLTGVLFGLAPGLQSTRPELAPTLKDQAGSLLGGGKARLRKAFVASQVAISLLLVVGAALFLRTLDNLLAVDVGFDANRLLTFSLDPSLNGYAPSRNKQLAKTLLERLRATPGVSGAGLASRPLLEGNQWSSGMRIEGYTPKTGEDMNQLNNSVSPGYFSAMGIPLLMGRDFDERDERSDPPEKGQSQYRVAIVNERFARHYFGDESPVGRHLAFGFDPERPISIEIVGVVRDAKYADVRSEVPRQVFVPYLETTTPRGFTVYVRTQRDPTTVFPSLRQAVEQLEPDLPLYGLRTLERQVAQSLGSERLIATTASVFGALATLLAVVGVYGVMAYTVERRTREIAIRLALGAATAHVGWLVVREALAIAAAGVAIGLPVAWWLGRYVSSQLYGVTATDPTILVGAGVGLGAAAALAALIPSSRAARIEPTAALRFE
jgi:predicted permease